jgi:arginine N-succinyltransferase
MPQSSRRCAARIPFLIREARAKDLKPILRLSRFLDSINLPTEERELARFLRRSRLSFGSKLAHPEDGTYLFLVEERVTGRIAGTSLIIAKHGTPESPHYYLEMDTDERYSKTLKKMFRHTYLTLHHSMDGPTEVGGLIVDPKHRGHPAKVGKQLSFVRFLYMAMHRDRFADEVIAEMMPSLTDNKESLFWEYYGKRVTGLSFREADKLSIRDKEFIDALFPPVPLYTCMLPPDVQESIGKVRPETEGAVHLLKKIGLRFLRHIDPFDGGPFYGARVEEIVLVAEFRRYHVAAEQTAQEEGNQELSEASVSERKRAVLAGGKEQLIGWEGGKGFRAARVTGRSEGSVLLLPKSVLVTLGLKEGTEIGAVPFL